MHECLKCHLEIIKIVLKYQLALTPEVIYKYSLSFGKYFSIEAILLKGSYDFKCSYLNSANAPKYRSQPIYILYNFIKKSFQSSTLKC